MTLPMTPARHIDEPGAAGEYADVLSRVATDRRPVLVRWGGADLAAVVPLEYLELLEEMLTRREAEHLAERLDWDELVKTSAPPQAWFDGDEPKTVLTGGGPAADGSYGQSHPAVDGGAVVPDATKSDRHTRLREKAKYTS